MTDWDRREAATKALQEATRRLGHAPTMHEYRRLGLTPSIKLIQEEFRYWDDALAAAGIEREDERITKEECLAALREARDILGHQPTQREYHDLHVSPSVGTIQDRCGSWSAAKRAAYGDR